MAGVLAMTGCAAVSSSAPVDVKVPGVPSPELALQKSIDRVHAFLDSINQRVDTPVRSTVALPRTNLVAQSAPQPTLAQYHPAALMPATGAEAKPLFGRGVAWFAFGDGYPRIRCAPGSTCIVRLAPGEIVPAGAVDAEPGPGWHATLVRGTRGIHADWAIALTAQPDAGEAVFHLSTNRRSYAMLLDPTAPSMRTVAFTYSANDPAAQPNLPQSALTTGGSVQAPDFAFAVTGADVPWKPIRVYADGSRTYVQFAPGALAAAPRLVIIAPAGGSSQPYKVVGDSYVIDRVITQAMLIGRGANAPTVQITHTGRHP